MCLGWVKNYSTSTLAFNIAQFFPSFNHQILSFIMDKVGFDPRISYFFSNYLVERKTKYLWNNFSSPFFDVNIGMGQDSALSPILSTLYLLLVFYIFEKRLKNLKILSSLLWMMVFLSPKTNLFCSYCIISCLLDHFGLVIEQGKTEVFFIFLELKKLSILLLLIFPF